MVTVTTCNIIGAVSALAGVFVGFWVRGRR
jgi:hypothetical protein